MHSTQSPKTHYWVYPDGKSELKDYESKSGSKKKDSRYFCLRGESKFEKCTLSVKVTFRGWGSNSIDALSGIHVSLIPKSILILTEILTLRDKGVGGSEDNVSLTLSVHFSNFDSPLKKDGVWVRHA